MSEPVFLRQSSGLTLEEIASIDWRYARFAGAALSSYRQCCATRPGGPVRPYISRQSKFCQSRGRNTCRRVPHDRGAGQRTADTGRGFDSARAVSRFCCRSAVSVSTRTATVVVVRRRRFCSCAGGRQRPNRRRGQHRTRCRDRTTRRNRQRHCDRSECRHWRRCEDRTRLFDRIRNESEQCLDRRSSHHPSRLQESVRTASAT